MYTSMGEYENTQSLSAAVSSAVQPRRAGGVHVVCCRLFLRDDKKLEHPVSIHSEYSSKRLVYTLLNGYKTVN